MTFIMTPAWLISLLILANLLYMELCIRVICICSFTGVVVITPLFLTVL